jgi:hypothetical protein
MRRLSSLATAVLFALTWMPSADAADHKHGGGGRPDKGCCQNVGRGAIKIRTERINELYENLVYPKPNMILAGQLSVDHIFDDSVTGRVTPAGHFHDEQAVNEYFFALASTPTSRVVRVQMQSLAASGDKVAVEVDIFFERTDGTAFTLRQTGFFTFNKQNRVISFDLTILNLGAAVNPRSDAEREANIQGLCAVLTMGVLGRPATCPSEYTDMADCMAFMHSIPYGTWDRANSNTVVCRQLHSLLTPYRPDVHCPHSGKSGGGSCVDFTYESFFDDEF